MLSHNIMNSCCYLCNSELKKNDYIFCNMKCNHILCISCFNKKRICNTFKCELCNNFVDNVNEIQGNNSIKSVPIKIGAYKMDKHFDEWIKIWNDLTKK